MTTLPNMGLVLPARGPSGAGTWDDTIDANLQLEDAHNHTNGKGARVPTAGISIDADLSFSSQWAPTNLQRIQFASVTALSSNNKSLFVNTSDNELYWRSNAGSNVKLTAGAALNVAAFTGGIGGDYTSVGAAVAFDDAGDRYTFKQQAPGNWARLASGEVRIFETGTTESVFVGLAAPAALAASYTITLPLAAPAATHPLQMTSAGVVVETGSITMAANESVTVSGTGRHKHGTQTLLIPAAAFTPDVTSVAMKYTAGAGLQRETVGAGGITVIAPIMLDIGKRVVAIRVMIADSSTGPTKLQASFISVLGSSGAVTTIASSAVSAGNSTFQTLTIGSLTTTMASGNAYSIKVVTTTGTDIAVVVMAEVDYDHP